MRMRLILPLLLAVPALAQQERRADVFAAIALDTPPASRPNLREQLPRPVAPVDLEAARSNPQAAFPFYHVMRTRAEFRTALAELRQRYQPFLADRTPQASSTRARLALDTFDFRMEETTDLQDIGRVWRGEGAWKPVCIPDYRGPIGWWAGYYRKVLSIPENLWKQESIYLRFGAVDYVCQVYLNGRQMGAHRGYFGPFEIDLTPHLRRNGPNVLVVRVENDSTELGLQSWGGPDVDGDKIYADAGLGWDEPGVGWHVCPPGAGNWQKVYLEGRPRLNITDIFVRPLPAEQSIEVRIEVDQPRKLNQAAELSLSIYPRNFAGPAIENISVPIPPAGPGLSEYRTLVRLPQFRHWTPEAPYLYTLRARLRPQGGGPEDLRDAAFGMREFHMDSTSAIKGTLYLNGEPVILRGANTMGHLMRAAKEENWNQLIDDILIAKLANMSYFRLTQSPVQPEVYDYFDRLGMLCQTDLPLFGYLRRSQLEEAVKQSGEMERLIRNHPSSIMVTYINEPFAADRQKKAHRDLTRPELELFFKAASAVVNVYNPDRVIKPVDGDYDPPGPGIPDNHIYSTWYASHTVPIGKFARGYWVAQKEGWRFGSGEYGSEGLEDAETMFRHYPKAWLPKSVDDPWNPGLIPTAQTYTMHHSWFDAETTMRGWIAASQHHQAWATRTMTRTFRRQGDRFVSTAIHLLIDAWPAGWMKTLVDVDRNPKPAFFEYRDALTPLMVDIRADRTRYYSGEKLQLEFWVCNDRRADFAEGQLVYEVLRNGQRVFAQTAPARIPTFDSAFQGYFRYQAPAVTRREKLTVRLGLKNPQGTLLHASVMEVEVFPPASSWPGAGRPVAIVGTQGGRAWMLAEQLGLKPRLFDGSGSAALVDDPAAFEMARAAVLRVAESGGTVMFLEQEGGARWRLPGQDIVVERMGGKEFISRKTGHPLVAQFEPFDFSYWYDPAKGYVEYVANAYLEGRDLVPLLITGKNNRAGDPHPEHRQMPVAAELKLGRGSLVFSQLKAAARVAVEPTARAYFQAILDR
jgi:hypothetical protein